MYKIGLRLSGIGCKTAVDFRWKSPIIAHFGRLLDFGAFWGGVYGEILRLFASLNLISMLGGNWEEGLAEGGGEGVELDSVWGLGFE